MKSDLIIKFGNPEHGWLPVNIKYKEITEEFHASDVPVDPLSLLTDSLFSAIHGRSKEVWWHLEPAGYFMTISKSKSGYELLLEYSIDSTAQTKEFIFSFSGSLKEIILPIWRALSEFYSHNYSEPAWPKGSTEDMKELKALIQNLK